MEKTVVLCRLQWLPTIPNTTTHYTLVLAIYRFPSLSILYTLSVKPFALWNRTTLGILKPTPPLGVSDFLCYHYTRRKLKLDWVLS